MYVLCFCFFFFVVVVVVVVVSFFPAALPRVHFHRLLFLDLGEGKGVARS